MISELALSTLMVLLTVAIHAAGLFGLSRLLRLEELEEAQEIAAIRREKPQIQLFLFERYRERISRAPEVSIR